MTWLCGEPPKVFLGQTQGQKCRLAAVI